MSEVREMLAWHANCSASTAMKTTWKTIGLCFALLAFSACSEMESDLQDCGERCDHNINEFPEISTTPKSVLFIPLRSDYVGLSEREWQSDDSEFDRSIRELTRFYEARGVDEIVTLPRISDWADLEAEVVGLGKSFDRVVIVSHGAIDGPLNKGKAFKSLEDNQLLELWNTQPGMYFGRQTSFDPSSDVGRYILQHQSRLLESDEPATTELVEQISEQDQAEHLACVLEANQRAEDDCIAQCQMPCEHNADAADLYANCDDGCYNQCLDDALEVAMTECSPIESELVYTWDVSRFEDFAKAMQTVVAEDGLLFLGHCNAATHTNDEGRLAKILSNTANNYVELLAEYTGRHVAGPVGSTSGQDVIDRVSAMERQRNQRYLFIAGPKK